MTTFNKIFDKNRYELEDLQNKSVNWFYQQIRSIQVGGSRTSAYYLMRGNVDRYRDVIRPGEMYMFYYDAKHKGTLPYWDRFPLVFPFRKLSDGFIGLNMHYLPYKARATLLDSLVDLRTTKGITENTRLTLSWGAISAAANYDIVKPTVHRYLTSHVRSPFKKVNGDEWATAIMLPVHQFVGSSASKVWNDSMRK